MADVLAYSPRIGITERRVKAGKKSKGQFLRCTANGERLECYLFDQATKPTFPMVGYGTPRLEINKHLECQLFPGKKVRCT